MNINKFLQIIWCGLVSLMFVSCSSSDDPVEEYTPFVPISLDGGSRAVSTVLPDFYIKLFQNVLKCSDDENVVMSPLSAFMTLSMIANGVDAEAQQEIVETLGCPESSIEDINNLCAKYMECLPMIDNRCTVDLGNAVWFNTLANVSSSYLDAYRPVLSEYFNADIRQASFSDPSTLTEINNWCRESTHGNIDKILNYLYPDGVGVWLNTLYFKGKWSVPFESKATAPGTFTCENGEKITVDMMSGKMTALHMGNEDYDAISIYYGNSAFLMVMIVPEEGKKLSDIDDIVSGSLLRNFYDFYGTAVRPYQLTIKMPKFRAESEIDLIDPLIYTGIEQIFGRDVFSTVAGTVSKFQIFNQKIVADIDESGSKVAVATVASDDPTGVTPPNKEFIIDKPFYYFILDTSTGAILVAGREMRP